MPDSSRSNSDAPTPPVEKAEQVTSIGAISATVVAAQALKDLELKKLNNDLINNKIKTLTAAVGMVVALGSAITGGVTYFDGQSADRAAFVKQQQEEQRLKLDEEEIKIINGFYAVYGLADVAKIEAQQIPAAILMRGLGRPGAAIIREYVYYAKTRNVSRTLGMSYANIATNSNDANAEVLDFANSIAVNWHQVSQRPSADGILGALRQIEAFKYVLSAIKGPIKPTNLNDVTVKQKIGTILKKIEVDLSTEKLKRECEGIDTICKDLEAFAKELQSQVRVIL
ncbi:MAG: hypothetical protein COB37_02195 [Kordiimonadales bacterium]|nr:MAG: hypothetical protein COB37_02195 [Kordiimonadales bacterium]